MKIEVRTPDLFFPLNLSFPIGMARSKLIWKMIEKSDAKERETIMKYKPLFMSCLDELTEYVRTNGHFDLVEVEEHSGTRVLIRI